MGVRIIRDKEQGYSVMYCSVTDVAFGNIFYEEEDADEFINWLQKTYHKDPREFNHSELQNKIYEWRKINESEN